MVIDAHHHLWTLTAGAYGWIEPSDPVLARDFAIADYLAETAGSAVTGSILVQADGSEADTDLMLEVAERAPTVLAVVGWTDLRSPAASRRIDDRASHPKLRGLRAMLQDDPEPEWILGGSTDVALDRLSHHGLTLDVLVRWRQMDLVTTLADRHPDLTIILDHGGKPPIGSPGMDEWRAGLDRLAQRSNVVCKLSGLATEVVGAPDDATMAPFSSAIIAAFGNERVIWGSDWPVCLSAQTFAEGLAQTRRLVGQVSGREGQDHIFRGNAARVYGCPTPPIPSPGAA